MKKFLGLLASLAFVVSSASAEAGAAMTFTKQAHDFGQLEKGEKVTYEWEFKNTGTEELIVSEVKPSCGCTTADLAKKNYKPGESGKIPITFDSTRFSGKVQKTITVTSNDATNPSVQLTLTGEIIEEVTFTPSYLTLVNVKRSEMIERTIDISTERLPKLEITDVTTNVPFLKLETIKKDDKHVSIKVSFPGSSVPAGEPTHTGFINFKTNAKSTPEVKINFYAKMSNPIQSNPRAVYMFASPKGKTREQKIVITSDAAFKVTSTVCDLEFVKLEAKATAPVANADGKPSAAAMEIIATLSETAPEGKFAGSITIKTDLAEQPEVTIPIRGNVN